MTTIATLFFGVFLLSALIDWVSVVADRPSIEMFAKPLVMVALIFAVLTAERTGTSWLIVAGFVLSLLGDIALLERVDRFVAGLASFFLAHLFVCAAFVAAMLSTDEPSGSAGRAAIGVVLAVVLLATIGRRIHAGAIGHDTRLHLPVAAYILVLSLVLVAGWATGAVAATVGATAFAASDAVLGWNRFVEPLLQGRFVTHILYHVAQCLFAVWAIGL